MVVANATRYTKNVGFTGGGTIYMYLHIDVYGDFSMLIIMRSLKWDSYLISMSPIGDSN